MPQDFAETKQTRIAQIFRLCFPWPAQRPSRKVSKVASGNRVGRLAVEL